MTGLRWGLVIAILMLPLLAVGCRQLSPEEQIEQLRAQYTAELNSITFEEPAIATEEEQEGESEPAAGAGGEGEEPVVAAEPAPRRVILDVLVSTESFDKLSGITLDVTHVDAERNEKDRRLVYIDTSALERGPGQQYTEVLENVEYAEGDGFHVEVRSPVAESERSRYREFAESGG